MCDTTVRITDDGVLFGKNSDRDVNECQLIEWHAGRTGNGDVACTWLSVPDAGPTNAVLLSRPWWMWGAEIGANEHGVVVGNEAVFTDQPYDDVGLLGMDLVRLGLERAASAERAVEVIVTLLERHGQGGPCSRMRPDFTYHNAFIVADPTTAIVLETAGRRWATEVVAPGAARSISNGLTIAGFAERHADAGRGRRNACAVRRAITEEGARRASGPLDLMATLRSHGAHEHPHYARVAGGMRAPCVHAGGPERLTETTSSWVADLRGPDPRHWVTGTAGPCTSLFKPIEVGAPIDLGPGGTDVYDPAVRWWRHERLHRLVDRDPEAAMPTIVPERDALERDWVSNPPPAGEAWAQADAADTRWLERVVALGLHDRRPRSVRAPRAEFDRLAGLPEATST